VGNNGDDVQDRGRLAGDISRYHESLSPSVQAAAQMDLGNDLGKKGDLTRKREDSDAVFKVFEDAEALVRATSPCTGESPTTRRCYTTTSTRTSELYGGILLR
jgi:hypothetical protein